MMGKRISSNSKARIASKGHDLGGGKPSSPGPSAGSGGSLLCKRAKSPSSQGKTREFPTLPHLSVKEDATALPRYSAASRRPSEEPPGMDELDALQTELENLLCAAALRRRTLQAELDGMDLTDSRREKKGKAAGKRPHPSLKRKHPEERPKEQPKQNAPGQQAAQPPQGSAPNQNQIKIPKFKNFPPSIPSIPSSRGPFGGEGSAFADGAIKPDASPFAAPKNNAPYKFWTSIDAYCGRITEDDCKFLESLLATSADAAPPPIPPLGRHYAELWSDESAVEERAASDPQRAKGPGAGADAAHLRRKADRGADGMIPGPLTQRLVSALIEDGRLRFDASDQKIERNGFGPKSAPGVGDGLALEKILRRELVEQGLLDPEDLPPLTSPADDEILAEIERCRTELNVLRKENARNLKNVLALCRREIARNEIKKRLDRVDAECAEAHARNLSAKLKKRPPTKKERDDAWKTVNEQIRLNDELNALPPSGPHAV